MRIFITGGMGYLGSILARELIKHGDDVCLYDSLIYEQDVDRMTKEIGKFDFVVGDTRNKELLEEALLAYNPHYVFHFAELSSVYSCNHNPRYTEEINYQGTLGVLALCEKLKISVIYNSSSSVYGTQKEMKLVTEDGFIPEPTDFYTKNKLQVEDYIKSRPDLDIIVLRPATVFGLSPRFRIELLPNHFTYMAIAKGVIPISGLNAYRAAIDIDELIQGYVRILDKGKWKDRIYNIGHYNMSKKEFAEGIKNVVPCELGFAPDVGDLRNLQIDCSKFNNEFDFHPTLTYEQSIKKVADWITVNRTKIEASNFAEMLNMPVANWKQLCQ